MGKPNFSEEFKRDADGAGPFPGLGQWHIERRAQAQLESLAGICADEKPGPPGFPHAPVKPPPSE